MSRMRTHFLGIIAILSHVRKNNEEPSNLVSMNALRCQHPLPLLVAISLKSHPEFMRTLGSGVSIANDPAILGLGNLDLKDKERTQPRAGRLDLLLQDRDELLRYEVEVQLGKTDESHIIRTIEYWDIERRRDPQYKHTAVIVAEKYYVSISSTSLAYSMARFR